MNTIDACMCVDGDVTASLDCCRDIHGTATIGYVTIRDGTGDYRRLENKPSIEGHTLIGDSTLPEIGVNLITEQDIDQIIYGG